MCHFKIFHSGYELNVVHTEPIENIIKIASHNEHVFILTTAKQLFFGSMQQHQQQQHQHNNESSTASMRVQQIEFELIRTDVIDVACSVDSIYVVDSNGFVQHCPLMAFDFDKRWNNIPILNCKSKNNICSEIFDDSLVFCCSFFRQMMQFMRMTIQMITIIMWFVCVRWAAIMMVPYS